MKKIAISGFRYSTSVPANEKVVFRATDAITINANFEVPLGSELELIIYPSPY